MGILLMPLFGAPTWRELAGGGFNLILEPGPYVICADGNACRTVQLAPHTETVLDLASALAKGN